MLSTERSQFDLHAAVLFAGCNLPVTAERTEAFWRGLQEMPLGGFVRVIDHALGEHGPENLQKISPQLVWQLYRRMRARLEHTERMAQQKTSGGNGVVKPAFIPDHLRMLMPKTKSGHIVYPDFLPPHQRKEYAPRWNAWADEHPGVIDKVAV